MLDRLSKEDRDEVTDAENPFPVGTLPTYFILHSMFYSSGENPYDEEPLLRCHLFSRLIFRVSEALSLPFCLIVLERECGWGVGGKRILSEINLLASLCLLCRSSVPHIYMLGY